MQLQIISPTKALVLNAINEDYEKLREELTYTNTSISYQLKKHYKSNWLKQNKPDEWQNRLEELKANVKKTLLYQENGQTFIRPGSIPQLDGWFSKIESKIVYPEAKAPYPWYKKPNYEPYSYQTETVDLLIENAKSGVPCAAQLATGLGKSYIMALATRKLGLRTLIVTPSTSIFYELLGFFEQCFGPNKVGTLGDGKKKTNKPIVIAIAKSITALKPDSEDYKNIRNMQVVMGDESHTLPAETLDATFHGVLSEIPYRFFLSGTQTRGDGSVPLLHAIIGKVVIDKGLAWGIENGYLSKLDFTIVNVPTSNPNYWNGDPIKMKRSHFLYNSHIVEFIAKTASAVARTMNKSSLILVEEIEQISLIAAKLTVPYTYVHGNTLKKDELSKYGLENRNLENEIERFNKGEIKVFIGTRCVSTGTNFYPTHFGFNFQGGSSEIGTKQGIMGRMTRLLEKSRYNTLHSPKLVSRLFDFNVDVEELRGSFYKRLGFYKESKCPIKGIEFK